MDYECVVFACRNSATSLQDNKIDCKFFNFPLNDETLTAFWLKKLNLEGWTPGPESVVCEEHFTLDCFELQERDKVLKSDAVPNVVVDECRRILIGNQDILNDQHVMRCNPTFLSDLRCRICAQFLSPEIAIDIYSEQDRVMEKIMSCIPIIVKAGDHLPRYICRLCLSDLNISYRMLVRAIESEKLFNCLLNVLQEKSTWNEDLEVDIERTWDDHGTEIVCVVCNVNLKNIKDLTKHLQDKHTTEFDLSDQCNEINDMDNLIMEISNNDESNAEQVTKFNGQESSSKEEENEIHDIRCIPDTILEFKNENTLKDGNTNICVETIPMQNCIDQESTYYVCDICLIRYDTLGAFNKHLESHIETVVIDECIHSDTDFNNKDSKFQVQAGYNDLLCSICSTVFSTCEEAIQHSQTVHYQKVTTGEFQKFKCTYCTKEFRAKLSLAVHERVHTGARPYMCALCGRAFKSKANLIQHDLVHSGIKRYKCGICEKAFARKSFVTTHMRIHTGDRPYECDVCGIRYTQIGDMRRHKKRHESAKLPKKRRLNGFTSTAFKVTENTCQKFTTSQLSNERIC